MADPRTFHFKLPQYQGPTLAAPPWADYPGIASHLPQCTSPRTLHGGDSVVRSFVIHATAGDSSSGAISRILEHAASFHWLIADENEPEHGQRVWRCVPESLAAWHVINSASHPDVNAGARYVNMWSLGVELVNAQTAGDTFSDWQVMQAAALVRYAWSTYPTLVDVVSHAKLDPTRRSDPGANFPWDRFRDLVLDPQSPANFMVSTPAAAGAFITVVGPDGVEIRCSPRAIEGVTMVHARPLIEALGFRVEYEDGPPRTVRVVGPRAASTPKRAAQRRRG